MPKSTLQGHSAPNTEEKLLSRKEAADLLGIEENTLAVWLCNKRYDLPVVKMGRLAKYRMSDLMAFIERRTINFTAE